MSNPPVAQEEYTGRSATRRTLIALLASAIGMVPLKGLFSDDRWLVDVWLTMIVAIGPAALIRLRRPPGALDIWPGIILLVPWLTLRFVPHHAWAGFVPTSGTWHDVARLMDDLHRTTRDDIAPIHSTMAVRLVVCALLGLLAALIDLIAVVGRRGALAGVPLLVIYTVSGAVPRKPVSWAWFAVAAVAFLLLLALDAGDDLRDWGRHVPAPGGTTRGRLTLAVSAQRIGVSAIVVAIVLPLLVPGHPSNLIANAFHGGGKGGSGVGGFGAGAEGGSISPFAALKGELDRSKPINLMSVHVDAKQGVQPFYLRTNILSRYDGDGWSVGGHGATEPLADTSFESEPPGTGGSKVSFDARITVSGLTGNAPAFALPTRVSGLDADTSWSPQDQPLLGASVHNGQEFSEQVTQPSPSPAQLESTAPTSSSALRPFLALPSNLPTYARDLVASITKGKTGPYERARALSDYFTAPANGFTYNLKTKPGDSGSVLVDFLKNKQGYCQQYAAAMAVMLRQAGVPSRVVLGYMHPVPDKGGNFTVTTLDAHAWVEAYFSGIGWIPFDPTPPSGLAGGAASDLIWAPHDYQSGANTAQPTITSSGARTTPKGSSAAASQPVAASNDSSSSWALAPLLWVVAALLVLIGLALVPALVRSGRRRRRYLAATRHGDADALWAELSDTAVDLGYVWSRSRSPRQVAAWLSRDAAASASSLQALAVAVEHRRYSPDTAAGDGRSLSGELREVTGELRSRRSGRARLRATLWPASLGWGRSMRIARRRR